MKKTILILFLGIILNTSLFAQESIKYPLKNGTVEYTMLMMGTETPVKMYFTDFGATQCTDVKMSMMGMDIHSRTILRGKTSFTLDMVQKTFTVLELSDEDLNKQFKNLNDEEALIAQGFIKADDEEVLGKNCQVYTSNIEGADTKLWSWKGLLMKMEATSQGMTISMTAQSINESVSDNTIFDIPADFTKNE